MSQYQSFFISASGNSAAGTAEFRLVLSIRIFSVIEYSP